MRVADDFFLRMGVVFFLKWMMKMGWLKRLLWMGIFVVLGLVSGKAKCFGIKMPFYRIGIIEVIHFRQMTANISEQL